MERQIQLIKSNKYQYLFIGVLVLVIIYLALNQNQGGTPEQEEIDSLKLELKEAHYQTDSIKEELAKKQEIHNNLLVKYQEKRNEAKIIKEVRYEKVTIISTYSPNELYKLCSTTVRRSKR